MKLFCTRFGLKKRFREPPTFLSYSWTLVLAPVVFTLDATKQENILKNCRARGTTVEGFSVTTSTTTLLTIVFEIIFS